MRENWKVCKLGDLVDEDKYKILNNLRKPISSGIRSKMKDGKLYPYYGAAGIIDYINDFKLNGFYLLIAEDGTVTSNGINPMLTLARGKFWVSNHAHIISSDEDWKIKFLYYLLSSVDINEYITGAVQPKLNKANLLSIKINLPPLAEQKAIAEILSSLDDKIDLLHRQNKTLEIMAESLFRHYFINNAKDDWKAGKLGDIISVIESGSRPKGGIDPELTCGIASIGAESIKGIGNFNFSATKFIKHEFFSKMKKGKVYDKDVLIYKDGAYIGRKGMFGCGFPFQEFAVNEHVFILRANELSSQYFLYFALDEEELRCLNTNSAQPGLNQASMRSFEIVIPPKLIIIKFDKEVEPLIDKILYNAKQIQTLERLRDTLLPKLISGELTIKDNNLEQLEKYDSKVKI